MKKLRLFCKYFVEGLKSSIAVPSPYINKFDMIFDIILKSILFYFPVYAVSKLYTTDNIWVFIGLSLMYAYTLEVIVLQTVLRVIVTRRMWKEKAHG